ncbi:MAG TPA: SDR family oxidoreductase [Candidatus Acidoferrales bacterium]|nr:SDR family oxidoreductase [Candidatus Acidoferrales bacterium]
MTDTRPLAAITGASSGIGAVFARALAARGYGLLLIARRHDRLEELARELKGEAFVADLTDDGDLRRVEARLRSAENLEMLVNNAGFGVTGAFASADIEGQDRMHRLHITATLRLTHAALGGMVSRRKGGIINVASVAGFLTNPGAISYCATKTWINSFTEGLYLELKAAGSPVRVQTLCPGFTYSEFHDAANMDRSKLAPKAWWLTAESVVAESLAGIDCDRLYVIPGFRYRALVWFVNRMPRALKHAVLIRAARRQGRM